MPGSDNAAKLTPPPYLQPLILTAHLVYQKLCQSIFTGRADMSTAQMKALTKLTNVKTSSELTVLTVKEKNTLYAAEIKILQNVKDRRDNNFNAICSILQTCAHLVTTEITENLFQSYFVHLKAQRKLLEVALKNEEHTFFNELDLFFQFLEDFNRVQYKAQASLEIAEDEKKRFDELHLGRLALEAQLSKAQKELANAEEELAKVREDKERLSLENKMLCEEIEQSCTAKDTLFAKNEKLFQVSQDLTKELITEREQKLALQRELATLKAEKSQAEADNLDIHVQIEQPQIKQPNKLTRTSSAFYNQLRRRTTSDTTKNIKLYPKTYNTF